MKVLHCRVHRKRVEPVLRALCVCVCVSNRIASHHIMVLFHCSLGGRTHRIAGGFGKSAQTTNRYQRFNHFFYLADSEPKRFIDCCTVLALAQVARLAQTKLQEFAAEVEGQSFLYITLCCECTH